MQNLRAHFTAPAATPTIPTAKSTIKTSSSASERLMNRKADALRIIEKKWNSVREDETYLAMKR
ncbi:hypothetical protein JCM19039_1212 [Geomicrobium sp. JCM 19039]|nr:hypothetical protein JCM19039_1212 [Geomicrobium sp. JCM 19039]